MSDMEGFREVMEVSLKMIDILEKLFGFTFESTLKVVGVTGKGFGKMVRLLFHLCQNNRMLGGGKRTFQQIVRNKGSLDMAISTVYIENWKSIEGKNFQEYLKNRGIQFVLLDDITKGENRVQFMFHASDAERVNSLLVEYAKLNKDFKADNAVSMADFYDSLEPEIKQEVNTGFEKALNAIDFKLIGVSENFVWNHIEQMSEEKKRSFSRESTKQISEDSLEIIIPKEYVKKDYDRELMFIRSGDKGYIVPLAQTEEVNIANKSGSVDQKIKIKIDKHGQYLQFENGKPNYIKGEKIADQLRNLDNHLDSYFKQGRKPGKFQDVALNINGKKNLPIVDKKGKIK